MSAIAIALIVLSAFMHASWNLISKRQNPSLAFFFLTTIAAALVMVPVLVINRQVIGQLEGGVWRLVVLTGIAQLIYFLGLAGAYRNGDISLAYPLARSLPVLMVVAVNLALGKGADIGRVGLLGMLLITVGCVILPLRAFRQFRLRQYFDIVYLMAVVAAVGTTGYTLIDDQALHQLRLVEAAVNTNTTLLYIALQTTSTSFMLGLGTLLYPPERRRLQQFVRSRMMLLSGVATGLIIMATYGLVLTSMAYVTNVSYVAAFRQLSIPIGAVLGFWLQHEPRYRPKLVGVGIVSVGLVLVGIG